MTTNNFTAFWIGRCAAKGCDCRLHIEIPMVEQRWSETHHNHAAGYSYEVPKSRQYPADSFGRHFTPSSLGMFCPKHRRQLNWTPVNGRYSTEHVCDSRCTNATGGNCECSCGGKNHGRGFHVELKFNLR